MMTNINQIICSSYPWDPAWGQWRYPGSERIEVRTKKHQWRGKKKNEKELLHVFLWSVCPALGGQDQRSSTEREQEGKGERSRGHREHRTWQQLLLRWWGKNILYLQNIYIEISIFSRWHLRYSYRKSWISFHRRHSEPEKEIFKTSKCSKKSAKAIKEGPEEKNSWSKVYLWTLWENLSAAESALPPLQLSSLQDWATRFAEPGEWGAVQSVWAHMEETHGEEQDPSPWSRPPGSWAFYKHKTNQLSWERRKSQDQEKI